MITIRFSSPELHPWTIKLKEPKIVSILNLKGHILNHIELFAGCGGLSLGLEKAGFNLAVANELSPMAAETFAYNLLGEDLEQLASQELAPKNTFWLSSAFDELKPRLRENPFQYPKLGDGYSTMPADPAQLEGKLVVANIIQLNEFLIKNPAYLSAIKSNFGKGGIDLISGGPPCQSFSLAGLREKNSDKNSLPWEFANFAELVQPKIVVLENVSGILRPFTEGDSKYYAWLEVAKVFASKGYIPVCVHINARNVGVAQNRPRFIMIAIRKDIYSKIKTTFNEVEKQIFKPAFAFFQAIQKGKQHENYTYLDFSNPLHEQLFNGSFLAHFVTGKSTTVRDAIDDLKFETPTAPSSFIKELNKTFAPIIKKGRTLHNHEPRSNNEQVRRRFRLYQVMLSCSRTASAEVAGILKGESNELSASSWAELRKFSYLQINGKQSPFNSKHAFIDFISNHQTKKRTQKALDGNNPAPAALSIPDDTCHYDEGELRTLTVREMARIQSFPDAFRFRSKITTGGQMRRFEVPQYTQVGNAVPPLLGLAIGKCVMDLLNRANGDINK